MKFKCQNEECEDKIKYCQYFAHMRSKCLVKRFRNCKMPDGTYTQNNNRTEEVLKEQQKNNDMFIVGDLNKLFLEPGEVVDAEILR